MINIEYLFMLDFSKSIKIEYQKSLESDSFINIERPESGDFTDSLTKDLPASKKDREMETKGSICMYCRNHSEDEYPHRSSIFQIHQQQTYRRVKSVLI